MITLLLIVHGLCAVALLGAVTHQACAASSRNTGRQRDFVDRYRAVSGVAFTNPIVVLFAVTCLGGAFLYPQYRIDVRPSLEEQQRSAANGVFEIKEHLAAIGLGLLPVYWTYWRPSSTGELLAARRIVTWIMTFIVWWSFLVGHVLNNIRGLLP